jgi:BolA protein
MAQAATPMEDAIRSKVLPFCEHYTSNRRFNACFQITNSLSPTLLEIHNDSHLHSHHKAMEGTTSREVRLIGVQWWHTC